MLAGIDLLKYHRQRAKHENVQIDQIFVKCHENIIFLIRSHCLEICSWLFYRELQYREPNKLVFFFEKKNEIKSGYNSTQIMKSFLSLRLWLIITRGWLMACSGSVIGHYNVSYALFVTLLGYQNRITLHPSNTSTTILTILTSLKLFFQKSYIYQTSLISWWKELTLKRIVWFFLTKTIDYFDRHINRQASCYSK